MKSFAYLLGGGGVVLQDLQPQTQLQLNKETLSIKILKRCIITSQCSHHWTQEMEGKLSACGLHADALALLIFLCSTIQKIAIMETKDAEHELSKKKRY